MSDPNAGADSVSEKAPVTSHPVSDWLLQHFVKQSNSYGIEMGITLQVGGCFVSGTLIGMSRYFELLSEQMRLARGNQELAAVFADTFAERARSLQSEDAAALDKDSDGPLPQFVHLRNVQFAAPGQQFSVANPNLLWRGRVASVGGWFLGSPS